MKSIRTVWSFIAKQMTDINDAILHELSVFRVINVREDRFAWVAGEGKSQSLENTWSSTQLNDQTVSLPCAAAKTGNTKVADNSAPPTRPSTTASGLAALAKPTSTASGLAAMAKPTSTASGLAAMAKPTSTASGLAAMTKPTSTATTAPGRKRISDISQLRLDAYVARTQDKAGKQTSDREGAA